MRQARLGVGKQVAEEPVVAQLLEGLQPVAGVEQLDQLVEQAGRGDVRRAGCPSSNRGRSQSGSMVNPSLQAKRTARSIRTGSSR